MHISQKSCTFAADYDSIMVKKVTYCIWSWAVLFAFCQMMVVKQLHHHEAHHSHEHICALDYAPIGECAHAHTSFVEGENEEDHCAICQFKVAKLFQPKIIISPVVTTQLSVLLEAEFLFLPGMFYAHCFGRAPPCF